MKASKITLATLLMMAALVPALAKSDWDEDTSKNADQPKAATGSARSSTPLQGSVEENSVMPSSVPPTYQSGTARTDQGGKLEGKAIDDELRGLVKDGALQPLSGLTDNTRPLQGLAIADPDASDQQLMVEWDRWRNRFLRAVQLGVQELVNNPDPDEYERPRVDPVTHQITSAYPLGTGTAFSCQITKDGKIKNLSVLESSGFSKYDKAVLRAVQQLEGTRILVFPKDSHRINVSQAARIKTATSSDFNYYHFGDVERVRPGTK